MEIFQKYAAQIRVIWAGLSAPHRFLAIAVVAALVITGGAVSFLSLNAEYVPIAPAMAPEEVANVVALLETVTIPHRLDIGGTTVLVPKDRLAQARVQLAAKGFTARGGKGLELFDEQSFGTTPFVQNVNYTRALQGELARSIMQIESVASARVMIAKGEPTPFVRDRPPTTASVVIKLKPGSSMNRAAAENVVSLVARSVEGLNPEHVTVIDSSGRLLSNPHAGSSEGISSEHFDYRQKVENYLSHRAEELLISKLGAGRAHVRVAVETNHQKKRERSTKYQSEERVARKESLTSVKSGGTEARGAAGAASNSGRNFVSAGSSQGGSGGEEDKSETEYDIPKTEQEIESNTPTIQRITVAVLADLSTQEGAKPLAVADVEAIVKQAVGYQSGRDEIKVSDVSLDAVVVPTESADKEWVERAQNYVHLARNVALLVAFGFLAATVLVLARRLVAATRPKPEPGTVESAAASTERLRFLELARQEPEQVARVLSALLHGNLN